VIEPRRRELTPEVVTAICDCVVQLVAIRAQYCNHLSVENVAPEILVKMLAAYEFSETEQ